MPVQSERKVIRRLSTGGRVAGRLGAAAFMLLSGACAAPGGANTGASTGASPTADVWTGSDDAPVIAVHCLYESRPWLNLDVEGDRDPEGIRYRVFLDVGGGKCELRPGTFHIEMYRIKQNEGGESERKLVSDWHYATSRMPRIAKPGMLGPGYYFHLRWADKSIAGSEVELTTIYEDGTGRTARSETKRLRVPKYPG